MKKTKSAVKLSKAIRFTLPKEAKERKILLQVSIDDDDGEGPQVSHTFVWAFTLEEAIEKLKNDYDLEEGVWDQCVEDGQIQVEKIDLETIPELK